MTVALKNEPVGKKAKLPKWKQEQRRIVRICKSITSSKDYLWKIPSTGFQIPNDALFAMNNHGQ